MSWQIHAITARELVGAREREIASLLRERELRAHRPIHSGLPRFGRIRRPLARLAAAIGSGASRAAAALDPQPSRS